MRVRPHTKDITHLPRSQQRCRQELSRLSHAPRDLGAGAEASAGAFDPVAALALAHDALAARRAEMSAEERRISAAPCAMAVTCRGASRRHAVPAVALATTDLVASPPAPLRPCRRSQNACRVGDLCCHGDDDMLACDRDAVPYCVMCVAWACGIPCVVNVCLVWCQCWPALGRGLGLASVSSVRSVQCPDSSVAARVGARCSEPSAERSA